MKRIAALTAGLLVVVSTLFGCASTPEPFRKVPWGTQPVGSDQAPWVTLINGDKGLENSFAWAMPTGSPCTVRFRATG
jgi:hypothetical protein